MKTIDEKFSAFSKIVKCIDSCESLEQTNSCSKLIDNFSNLFKKDFKEMSYYESRVLIEVLQKKASELK